MTVAGRIMTLPTCLKDFVQKLDNRLAQYSFGWDTVEQAALSGIMACRVTSSSVEAVELLNGLVGTKGIFSPEVLSFCGIEERSGILSPIKVTEAVSVHASSVDNVNVMAAVLTPYFEELKAPVEALSGPVGAELQQIVADGYSALSPHIQLRDCHPIGLFKLKKPEVGGLGCGWALAVKTAHENFSLMHHLVPVMLGEEIADFQSQPDMDSCELFTPSKCVRYYMDTEHAGFALAYCEYWGVEDLCCELRVQGRFDLEQAAKALWHRYTYASPVTPQVGCLKLFHYNMAAVLNDFAIEVRQFSLLNCPFLCPLAKKDATAHGFKVPVPDSDRLAHGVRSEASLWWEGDTSPDSQLSVHSPACVSWKGYSVPVLNSDSASQPSYESLDCVVPNVSRSGNTADSDVIIVEHPVDIIDLTMSSDSEDGSECDSCFELPPCFQRSSAPSADSMLPFTGNVTPVDPCVAGSPQGEHASFACTTNKDFVFQWGPGLGDALLLKDDGTVVEVDLILFKNNAQSA